MRLIVLSDTHNRHNDLKIPDGDVIIHCGDFSNIGSVKEVSNFTNWFSNLPHKVKIMIAGNHDFLFQNSRHLTSQFTLGITYLEDSVYEYQGVKFFGSPYTQQFFDWAFMETEEELEHRYSKFPVSDVLITHGPAYGILDKTHSGENGGSKSLLSFIQRTKPKYHLFGHIHESYGEMQKDGTYHINAALDRKNKPIVIDI